MSQSMTGTVISTHGDKTAIIKVVRHAVHPIYKKRFTISKNYHVHDPENKTAMGDLIQVKQIKPVSRHKRWQYDKTVRAEAKEAKS